MNGARAKAITACTLLGTGMTGLFLGGKHLPIEVPKIIPPHALRSVTSTFQTPARPRRSGLASWYGQVFDGRRTANGEIFSKDAMTACHRTLPFGTLVRVINLRNRKSVVVRINDRGVLTPQRIIDLSSAAAQKIGMLEAGITPVRLEIVPSG